MPADVEPAAIVVYLPVEVWHATATPIVEIGRAEGDDRELPLDLGVLRPEREDLLDGGGTEPVRLQVVLDLIRARRLVQVDELEFNLDGAIARDGEVLLVNFTILPRVSTIFDHFRERSLTIDRHGVLHVVLAGELFHIIQELLEVFTTDNPLIRHLDQLGDLIHGDFAHFILFLASVDRQFYTRPYAEYITANTGQTRRHMTGGNPQPSFVLHVR